MRNAALIFLLFYVNNATAQTTEDSVKAAINHLFTAMKTADGEILAACFTNNAILQTIANDKTGKLFVRHETADGFISQIKKLPKDSADERITFDVIKTDGPLATAWTPYRFYYAGKFSHCGVNSFQLVRLEGIWKIQYIIDTRRRTDCP